MGDARRKARAARDKATKRADYLAKLRDGQKQDAYTKGVDRAAATIPRAVQRHLVPRVLVACAILAALAFAAGVAFGVVL